MNFRNDRKEGVIKEKKKQEMHEKHKLKTLKAEREEREKRAMERYEQWLVSYCLDYVQCTCPFLF